MAQLQLPRVDANALRERMRDIDLSRLADLGDELKRLGVADELKRLGVADGLKGLEMAALRRLDVDALRHVADAVEHPELDLASLRDSALVRRAQRALGRQPRRKNLWSSLSAPSLGATIVAGATVVLAGAAIGGLAAWLFQPGKGDLRRARIRRRVGRLRRRIMRSARPT